MLPPNKPNSWWTRITGFAKLLEPITQSQFNCILSPHWLFKLMHNFNQGKSM